MAEMLKNGMELLRALDEKIQKIKVSLARRCQGPRPKGVGALSLVQLEAEVLDWNRYSSGRKIGCLAGLVPSEWSTGTKQRPGLDHQSGSTSHSAHRCGGGLALDPLSTPV